MTHEVGCRVACDWLSVGKGACFKWRIGDLFPVSAPPDAAAGAAVGLVPEGRRAQSLHGHRRACPHAGRRTSTGRHVQG